MVECELNEETPSVKRLLEKIGKPVASSQATPAFRVFTLAERDTADGLLDQLRQRGKVRVLAEPTMVTLSGQQASLHCGGEISIPAPEGSDEQPRTEEYGTRLDALPVLKPNGTLRLDVRLSVRELDTAHIMIVRGKSIPGLRSRAVSTAVEMKPEQTLVMVGGAQQPDPAKPADKPSSVLLVTVYTEVVSTVAQSTGQPLTR